VGRSWWIIKFAMRWAWRSAMVLVPLFGFWLASSVAAYENASTWVALAIGLALFPLVPVGWDLVYMWRRRRREGDAPTRTILTRLDRLVLRTLLVNGLFLGLMIATLPRVTFRALAVRGDWMLDGAHGSTANSVRHVVLGIADHFEKRWHVEDDRYGESDEVPDDAPPAAQPYPGWPMESTPEVQVSDMPESAQTSIESVGAYLSERIPDTRRRIKAVHDYVALRTSYDTAAMQAIGRKDPSPPQDAESVFKARTGVCEGYARLMVALGKASGLEITYIVGYARDGSFQTAATSTDQAIRSELGGYLHAWNAAKVDGQWQLIDATWDRSGDGTVKSDYLFTPPELFAEQHLPDLPPWQLLAEPITAGEFVRRPMIEPFAGKLGVKLIEPTRSQVTTDGALDLELDNPNHATLTADFVGTGKDKALGGDGEAVRHNCGEWTSDDHPTLHCDIPAGTYEVRLFGAVGPHAHHVTYFGSISVER
jgi:transglutaminase-like putative cysteine protease